MTRLMSCSTSRIAVPRSRTTRCSTRPNASVSTRSRPDDGSSSSRTSNEPASARASSTRRRWPVERSPAFACARWLTPQSRIASRVDSSSSARSPGLLNSWDRKLPPASSASRPSETFSATVMLSKSCMRWNVRPRPRRARAAGRRELTSAPFNRIWPVVGRSSPEHALKVVVLPAPLGPINPVMRPIGASRLTSSTARCPPKRTFRPRTSSPTPACSAAPRLGAGKASSSGGRGGLHGVELGPRLLGPSAERGRGMP